MGLSTFFPIDVIHDREFHPMWFGLWGRPVEILVRRVDQISDRSIVRDGGRHRESIDQIVNNYLEVIVSSLNQNTWQDGIALIDPCSQPYEMRKYLIVGWHNTQWKSSICFISTGKKGTGSAVGNPYILRALISSEITFGHLYSSISWGS